MVERAVDDLDAALEGDGVVHRRIDVEGQRRRHLIKTKRQQTTVKKRSQSCSAQKTRRMC